ncbi:glycosyltransferase [Streptomyces apricus]|uniref:Glycosyltransferase family 1 protein n=1 Tax=Streptomyces apricus TaxID=1828112 RepID=A0A5B0BKJ4_9ACTN|nr:glycosyltransferase [Streptomyces apricus]KAA0941802.1 glycosyltransferase family 1 protein [Streptomyces apricus]
MTAGSRGDAAPYTGLGHGLARGGHEVTVVTHGRFEPLVTAAGLGFRALPVDPRAELESARGRALHRSATGAGKLVRLAGMTRSLVGRMADDLVAAAGAADVLLLSSSLAPLGRTLAEGYGLPSMGVFLQPLAPTGEFAPPVTGTRSLGATGNRLAGRAVNRAVDGIFAAATRDLRARFGLAPLGARAARRARRRDDWQVHHGFSPLVVARPRDWRPGLDVTGYWWPYDPAPRLPDALRDFLDAGPPPVFFGLGSATVPDAERLSAEVVRALRAAGMRGVVQRGWAGLSAGGDDVFTVGEVPHAALFPHLAAVVHHAGAGTTAAVLRTGVPTVPVPVQFDEGFWAARLVSLGVAPAAVPLRGLTADALAGAVARAVTEPSYARRAKELAGRLRGEDGVRPVLAAVDRLAGA